MQGQLDKLHNEIRRTLEKISSREKYINNQLENHIAEFRNAQDQLAQVFIEHEECLKVNNNAYLT